MDNRRVNYYILGKIQIISKSSEDHTQSCNVELQASLFNLSCPDSKDANQYTPNEEKIFNFMVDASFREAM